MAATVTVPARFNGPQGSGNGGYTCGIVAATVGGGPVEVSLRAPPPLDQPLTVEREGVGVTVSDGDTTVATATPKELLLDVPDPVSNECAENAAREGFEAWSGPHPFPTCFVCGPDRDHGDGMRVFPGALGDGRFAAGWTPDESLAVRNGIIRPEFVWAALDCPTSAPVANFGEGPAIVLARLHARVECPVRAGEPHALVSWPLDVDGRKRHAGSALFDSEGRLLAAAQALWIELRQPAPE
jgi:hypothetical protein